MIEERTRVQGWNMIGVVVQIERFLESTFYRVIWENGRSSWEHRSDFTVIETPREYADRMFGSQDSRWCYNGEHCGNLHPIGPTHEVPED